MMSAVGTVVAPEPDSELEVVVFNRGLQNRRIFGDGFMLLSLLSEENVAAMLVGVDKDEDGLWPMLFTL